MNIHWLDLFENTVKQNSDKIAVRHNGQEISFCELGCRAKVIGEEIYSQIDGVVNKPVAVFLPKEINTVVADLGILYSGNPFMNLDIKTPIERIRNIINLIQPVALVTSLKYIDKLECFDIQHKKKINNTKIF